MRERFAQHAQKFAHLREGIDAIHFLYGNKADQLVTGVRRPIDRAGPTDIEFRILHRLARKLIWIAGQQEKPGRLLEIEGW